MIDILGIGELLIDFTPVIVDGKILYQQNAGGAPCNMLTMAQNLGSQTAFIGKVGADHFGLFLEKTLKEYGVNTVGLIKSYDYNTTLAFVHLDDKGERSFSFYRKSGADIMLSTEEIDYSLIDKSKVVHFGSLSFTDEPSKSSVIKVLEHAKNRGKLITYDPNYRPLLWNSEESAIEGMSLGLKYADIIKVSEEEAILLTGEQELEKAGQKLHAMGIKLVCITLGDKGAFYYYNGKSGIVSGFKSDVVDTTGAGDAFMGCVVHQIVKKNCRIENLTVREIMDIFNNANAAASLCIEKLGGIPAMPKAQEVVKRAGLVGVGAIFYSLRSALC